MAKNFENIKTDYAAKKTGTRIETGTSRKGQQANAPEEEIAERKSQLRTQGRKGCRAERINVAITPENHDFLRITIRFYFFTFARPYCRTVFAPDN